MLLSRLKSRNKTGPSIENQAEVKTANKKGSHLVSCNTWTAPELETVLPPSGDDHNSTPSLQQGHKDVTAILPELPNSKGVKLPPIKRKPSISTNHSFSGFVNFFPVFSFKHASWSKQRDAQHRPGTVIIMFVPSVAIIPERCKSIVGRAWASCAAVTPSLQA